MEKTFLDPEALAAELEARWNKPFVARDNTELREATGEPLKARTMANLDCAGQGVPVRIRHGRRVLYPAAEFFRWYASRLRPVT
jgi:hypothetical protein